MYILLAICLLGSISDHFALLSSWLKKRRRRKLMDQLVSVLGNQAAVAMADGARFQVPAYVFDTEDDIRAFINAASAAIDNHVRASIGYGLLTLYLDDELSDDMRVVVATVDHSETIAKMAREQE